MQIVEKDPLKPNGPPETSLVEIGPRFVLTPIRIFEGAFGGATVYSNPGACHFPSPCLIAPLFHISGLVAICLFSIVLNEPGCQ